MVFCLIWASGLHEIDSQALKGPAKEDSALAIASLSPNSMEMLEEASVFVSAATCRPAVGYPGNSKKSPAKHGRPLPTNKT